MVRSFRRCSYLLAGVLGFAGCVANQYEIELTPQGGKIEREITAWHGGNENPSAFPQEELKNIAGAYKAEVPQKLDQKHTFTGLFEGQMPDDVSGAGTYTHWKTSLGMLSVYVERFRGSDDLLAEVEQRLQACDRLTNILIGWMESELKTEPGFPALKKFLDEQFRRDLKNLSLHSRTFEAMSKILGADSSEARGHELLVRLGQYLIERSYVSVDDLPRLVRAFEDANDGDSRPLLAFFQRLVASRMNIPADQPVPKSLDFLADLEDLSQSFDEYFRQTDEYRQMMKAGEKPRKPGDVLVELAFRALPWWSLSDRLNVKLALPAAPISTNGQWDEEAKQVRWSRQIEDRDAKIPEFPVVAYALWSQPDDEAQTRRFGRVILEGDALGKYCLWERGLTEAESKEWQTFLASLKPGKDLHARLETFHFSQEPAPHQGEKREGLAGRGCQLLLEGLGAGTEEKKN